MPAPVPGCFAAGTFTLNYMELRKISVGSYSFGLGTTQIGLAGLRRKGAPTDVIARRERENAIADKQVCGHSGGEAARGMHAR